MRDVQVFSNPDFGSIRSLSINGEPWFVGKDVAEALGYNNTKDALSRHVESEDKVSGDGVVISDPMGRTQHPVVINESGLYSLILSSRLPSAKKFKRWVTSEVLPSIRKTGSYHLGLEPIDTTALPGQVPTTRQVILAKQVLRLSELVGEIEDAEKQMADLEERYLEARGKLERLLGERKTLAHAHENLMVCERVLTTK